MTPDKKNKKYVVVKRQDFETFVTDLHGHANISVNNKLRWLMQAIVEDAVVIRRQDVFAPPAFDAYANTITCLLQADEVTGVLGLEQREGLLEIALYFAEQAEMALQQTRKLPD